MGRKCRKDRDLVEMNTERKVCREEVDGKIRKISIVNLRFWQDRRGTEYSEDSEAVDSSQPRITNQNWMFTLSVRKREKTQRRFVGEFQFRKIKRVGGGMLVIFRGR